VPDPRLVNLVLAWHRDKGPYEWAQAAIRPSQGPLPLAYQA
jgi:hypothetical protein